jgi:hypothetical protein
MGPTLPPTGIYRRAVNFSSAVSTQYLNKVNSRTVDEALVLPKGGFETYTRILLVVNKQRGIGDIL